MSADAARWLADLRQALAAALLPNTPPTPVPDPPGGGETLAHQPPPPRATVKHLPPPSWRNGVGGAPLGLAVSGGGDSMALLHLAAVAGLPARAVTVDHGLRPEAAAEAAFVAQACAGLGIPHDTLTWHWDGKGNLQDAARRARRSLIGAWAQSHGLAAVALAHTQDDLAETFLMRLARGAGLDGLSAMSPAWPEAGVVWLRPLLAVTRDDLRTWLRDRSLAWIEDPSNANPRFDRVKARRALVALAPLGLTAPRLAEVAGHLAQARQTLEEAVDAAWPALVTDHGIALHIDAAALAALPADLRRRLVLRAVRQLAPGDYSPRGPAVTRLIAALLAGRDATLSGCRFLHRASGLWACREAQAVAHLSAPPGQAWDGRWRITGPCPPGAELRALGATGLAQCPGWRATGLPRPALIAAPALWLDDRLLAAPHAGFGDDAFGLSAPMPAPGRNLSILSH